MKQIDLVTISKLEFTYKKGHPILEHLDLKLKAGHIYGILGKNGAGKTTLLNLISGLLFPQRGTMDVVGYRPSDRKVDMLANIFFVPEDVEVSELSPKIYAGMYGFFYPKFSLSDFERYLSEFGIDINEKMTDLSTGQQKKLCIAFALACRTDVLLMDEPTNGLDIVSKEQFRRLMASVEAENRCILISTHQVRDLENLIDSILILNDRRIVFNQSMDRVSEKLNFISCADSKAIEEAIFTKSDLLGGKVVVKNGSSQPARVDLELLFGVAVSDPDKLNKAFDN